jgi:hypothetical protein
MASGMNRHPVRKLRCRPGNRNPSFGQWLTRSRTIKTLRRLQEAAAGSGRSEHRNVDILIPLARQRESPTGPNVPCERRTDPAEPRQGTDPQRQPQHSNTAKKVRVPGCLRRSFRTLRLCAIPGVSPRAGMRCPIGALRTPHQHRAPTASASPPSPPPPHHHHNTPGQRRLFFLNGNNQTIP